MAKQQEESRLAKAALNYAVAHRIPVFPLHGVLEDGTCTCKRACNQAGKHPRTAHGHRDATTSEVQIAKWWKRWPDANIGAVSDGLLCLDVDVKRNDGLESLQALIAEHAALPETATAETGANEEGVRGRHYWFTMPEGVQRGSSIALRDGIDLKTSNGYAILPPSKHVSGVEYEWMVGIEEITEAPQWLIDLMPERLNPKARWSPPKGFHMAKETREFLHGRYEPDGDQRTAFVGYARAILSDAKTIDEAAELLWEGYDGKGGMQSCETRFPGWPWTAEDAQFITESTFRTSPPPMRSEQEEDLTPEDVAKAEAERLIPYDHTDADNGRRLVDSYDDGHGVFYVPAWRKWYMWDGTTWAEDKKGTLLSEKWLVCTRTMFEESAGLYNEGKEDAGKALTRWATNSRQAGRIVAATTTAQLYCSILPDALNADDFLLNCRNGVLDLRTGALSDPDPTLLLTKRIRAGYVPGAQSDLWDRVLAEWIPDEEMRLFVQKAFGYTLTGSTAEHKFFFFYGPPGSGKSTLVEAFKYLMGNYAETAETETFMLGRPGQGGGGPSEDLARLSNARMVVTSEAEEGSRFAEAKVSRLTGGDTITARFLHANSFEFVPKFKLFFTANHRPKVSGSAQSGLWRRLIIVPVDRVIPDEDKDPLLPSRLRTPEVLEAILAWAVEGCRMWVADYEAGHLLEVPASLVSEVEEYRTDADHLYRFLSAGVVKVAPADGKRPRRVKVGTLYEVYQAWCTEEGVPTRAVLTKNMLGRKLAADHGWIKAEGRVGATYNGPYWENRYIPMLAD